MNLECEMSKIIKSMQDGTYRGCYALEERGSSVTYCAYYKDDKCKMRCPYALERQKNEEKK